WIATSSCRPSQSGSWRRSGCLAICWSNRTTDRPARAGWDGLASRTG
ncbi:MAG: hypothetical protein AVDCRST_MAG70-2214, partial [uncultured Thermomicrobiales bacterium]